MEFVSNIHLTLVVQLFCIELMVLSSPESCCKICYNFLRDVKMDNRKPQDNFTEFISVHDMGHCINLCASKDHCKALFFNSRILDCGMVNNSVQGNLSVQDSGWIYLERQSCCRNGWRRFQKKCFLFSNIAYSFNMAKEYCQDKGAYLMEIKSLSIDVFINQNMKKDGIVSAWTGAFRTDDIWKWEHSQADLSINFTISDTPGTGQHIEYRQETDGPYGSKLVVRVSARRTIICETDDM